MCVECCHQPCAAAKLTQKLTTWGVPMVTKLTWLISGLKITGSNLGHRALQKCRLGKNLKKLAYWVKRISVNVTLLKSNVLQSSQKGHHIFGLLLYKKLSPTSYKNRPIWSRFCVHGNGKSSETKLCYIFFLGFLIPDV